MSAFERAAFWVIAGGSASGKSYLCNQIKNLMPSGSVAIIGLDSYYKCNGHIPFAEREKVNYDHPDAFDLQTLLANLRELRAGKATEVPIYDFATHSRKGEVEKVEPPSKLLILEGILVLYWPELREVFDRKIFVSAGSELRLKRRLARDVAERGRSEESVHKQWTNTVESMFSKFCEPTKGYADLVLNGEEITEKDIKKLLKEFV